MNSVRKLLSRSRRSLAIFLLVGLGAAPARAAAPISNWVDLPTLRLLVRQCTNAITEVNAVFANDSRRAFFFGGGGLRGTLDYIYRELARGRRPEKLCRQFIGSIADFTQAGADRDLFMRKGLRHQGNKAGWDILESSFWEASRRAGGAAIEKVFVRPDEIDDPFDAIAAYHRGESPYIDVPESVFAQFRSRRNPTGLRDNRKTALVLRWLRFNEDIAGITVTPEQYRQAASIVYSEIATGQLPKGNYWVDKALKKHFHTMIARHYRVGQNLEFWKRYLQSLLSVGIGCHFAKIGYVLSHEGRNYPMRDTFSADRCVDHDMRVQLEGARNGISRTSLPAEYRTLSIPRNRAIPRELADGWLVTATAELDERLAGTAGASVGVGYALHPQTLSAYRHASEPAQAEFQKTFAAWLDSPTAQDARFWREFAYVDFRGTPFDTDRRIRNFAALGLFADEAAFIERFGEIEPEALARSAYADALEGGSRYFAHRHAARGAVGDALDRALNDRIRELAAGTASAEKGQWIVVQIRNGSRIAEETFRDLASRIDHGDDSALALARRIQPDAADFARFLKRLSPARELEIAYGHAGRSALLADLAPGRTASLRSRSPFSPAFREYLRTGSGADPELFARVRHAAYADLGAALRDGSLGAKDAWELVRFGAAIHPVDGSGPDLLALYAAAYGPPADLESIAAFWGDAESLRYPSAREVLRRSLLGALPLTGRTRAKGIGPDLKTLHAALAGTLRAHGLDGEFEALFSGIGIPEQKLTIWAAAENRRLDQARKCHALLARLP